VTAVDLALADAVSQLVDTEVALALARDEAQVYRTSLQLALNGWHHAKQGRDGAEARLRQIMGIEAWHPEETNGEGEPR